MKKLKFTWNVFLYDSDTRQPVTYNIFDNRHVYENTPKLLKKCKDEEEFKEEFRKLLEWQFRARCQYEILISPYEENYIPLSDLKQFLASERHKTYKYKTYKLDVYEQCMLNFDNLVSYIWVNHVVREATKGFKKYAIKTEKGEKKSGK